MDAAAIYNAFAGRFGAAQGAVATATANAASVIRNNRTGAFQPSMLSAPRSACHHDVYLLIHAATKETDTTNICTAILSAVVIAFSSAAVASAPRALNIPETAGLPGLRGTDGKVSGAGPVVLFGKSYTPGVLTHHVSDDLPLITQRDAAAILTIAVYAAGKRVTADNMGGILGSEDTKGRVGAVKEVSKAHDAYLKGGRALKAADVRLINGAFAVEPAARAALFYIISSVLPAPSNPYEQIVASQARLLRSEGRGSFDRAVMAIHAFGEILILMPKYKSEMEAIVQIMTTLANEHQAVRDYGFIIYQEAYETLRVNHFRNLAGLGLIASQDDPASSTSRVVSPLSSDEEAKATTLYGQLKTMFEARITALNAEMNKKIAEATAAAKTV